MTYTGETKFDTTKTREMLKTSEMKTLWRIVGHTRTGRKPNKVVNKSGTLTKQTHVSINEKEVEKAYYKLQLRWIGFHVLKTVINCN